MYTNIRSLRYKVHKLEWEAKQFQNVAVICLTETHLGSDIYSGELNMLGYQLFRKDRNDRGGGVAAYVRNNIQQK